MRPEKLRQDISDMLATEGLWPAAVVATAGTTDFGSIDPLREIATIAREQGIWLHVDAAYGGALLLSDCYRERLAGLEQADSVTIDFHKAFFQSISCSAFLVADQQRFENDLRQCGLPQFHEQRGGRNSRSRNTECIDVETF